MQLDYFFYRSCDLGSKDALESEMRRETEK